MRFSPDRIPIYNNSGEDIPPYACMAVTGFEIKRGIFHRKVGKPDTILWDTYLFNGPTTLSTTDGRRYGIGYHGPMFLCETSPTFSTSWGVKPGQWSLVQNYPTLALIDGEYASSGSTFIGYGVGQKITALVGFSDGPGTARSGTTPGTGSIKIYAKVGGSPGVLTDTTIITNYFNLSSTAITTGKYIQCKLANGFWWIDFEDC